MSLSGISTRIGVLIPENNTTVERELPLWLPAGMDIELLRIPRGKGLLTTEALPAYKHKALELARTFNRENIGVVAYSCTAAGFILGPAGDRELTQQLRETTGKPVATIASSMISALTALRVGRIAVVTPYSDRVNEQLKSFISEAGIEVSRFDSMYAKDVDALGRITSEEVAEMARKTMGDECEAMFIACAQLPTFGLLEELQEEFGRPVLSSIQSLAAQVQALASRAT